MTDRKLMQQVLEALEIPPGGQDFNQMALGVYEAIKILRERLAQPEQEPVWIQPNHLQKARQAPFLCRVEPEQRDDFVPLYTTPQPRREWVGLTDEEVEALWCEHEDSEMGWKWALTRAIEAHLKEKNT